MSSPGTGARTPSSGARPRAAAHLAILAGAVIALVAAVVGPRPVVPLYDGVVPTEPYRWLDSSSGTPGDPTSATTTVEVTGGANPLIAIATDEVTPQAQLFAAPGALTLPPGTSSLSVSITPVRRTSQPTDGAIAGNVYRILVANQAGALATAAEAAKVSIVLRSPDPATTDAVIEAFDGTTWRKLSNTTSNLAGTFVAVVTAFGDFAVVLPGEPSPSAVTASAPPPSFTVEPPQTEAPAASAAAAPSTIQTALRVGAPIVALVLVALLAVIGLRRGGSGPRGPRSGGRSSAWGGRRRR